MWEYIARTALRLEAEVPDWGDMPQMMRLNITTYNVLEMLGNWKIARPYNFPLLPRVDPLFGRAFGRRANEKNPPRMCIFFKARGMVGPGIRKCARRQAIQAR
jgi:hypothetical protein